jgi:large subunit ribosomal protein L20
MTRVKRGTISLKRRRNILQLVKGYRHGRKSKERLAIEALKHAGRNAFRDRKKKKSVKRALWQIKISGALKQYNVSFSKFIDSLHKKNIELDRKVLASIAEHNPETFERIVETSKK